MFLDADDIMTPHRVQTQVACVLRNKDAIVGGSWRRHPAGSTEHYERWANALPDPAGLWLEQFRETTVQMPTWCLMRATYDKVGGFDEIPPDRGEGEDLVFFHKHLDAFDAEETRCALGLGRGEGEGGKRKTFHHRLVCLCAARSLRPTRRLCFCTAGPRTPGRPA